MPGDRSDQDSCVGCSQPWAAPEDGFEIEAGMENGSKHNATTAATPARVLIIEDEEHARRYLRELLEDELQLEVVGESSNGVQGVQQIRELSPDIVFVDIQMPGLDGFGMIDQIAEHPAATFCLRNGLRRVRCESLRNRGRRLSL